MGNEFKSALSLVMKGLSSRKGRAPGTDGVYAELLTVVSRLPELVIIGIWEVFGGLGMFPKPFGIEVVETLWKIKGSRSDFFTIDRSGS